MNDVNIEVKEGEFVAIMGPSGCGKSTLLNILGLLDNPTSGEYYLNGTEVSKYTEAQRTNLRKGVIGFVFQSFNLIDELNVYENIELPLLYMGIPATERKRRVETAMERMAIMHRSKHFPQQLSGGQQQRVAIARAVVSNPKLILADGNPFILFLPFHTIRISLRWHFSCRSFFTGLSGRRRRTVRYLLICNIPSFGWMSVETALPISIWCS